MTRRESPLEKLADLLVEEHSSALEQLIDVRKSRGLTEQIVARRMGVAVRTVYNFEHYDSNPTLTMIRRYALAVGASMSITVEEYHDTDE